MDFVHRLCTINAQTIFFMFCQHIFTSKTLQTTFTKVFFVSIFCFAKHESVKIFDIHVMWLVFISYKQQIHRVFKFLIRNANWKSQLVFITKHIDTNVVFCFNLPKIFFSHTKLNPSIIKIISKLVISLYIFTGLICLTWHHKKKILSLFLMLISPLLDFLIRQATFHKDFLIMAYKLKY